MAPGRKQLQPQLSAVLQQVLVVSVLVVVVWVSGDAACSRCCAVTSSCFEVHSSRVPVTLLAWFLLLLRHRPSSCMYTLTL